MTTYYVGAGGNDANAGTSWALRKLTLNGAEDIPVAAGDTVYVGPGTYRETLTCDVSGSVGSPITYVGDYSGANTDGVGGVVRITGSDNDITATRNNCVTCGAKRDYRTFRGFAMDLSIQWTLHGGSDSGTNWIVEDCHIQTGGGASSAAVVALGANQAAWTVRRCLLHYVFHGTFGVQFYHTADVSDTGHVVENCIAVGVANSNGVHVTNIGGITVRNCVLSGHLRGVSVAASPAAGQTVTVNNCVLFGNGNSALYATALGDITENYNALFGNITDRTNVSVGANSNAYPMLPDTRWFFEAVNGGNMVTPFDVASYSKLVELNSGTGAPSADLRGTTVQGTYREWGPLEYDSVLDIEAGSAPDYPAVGDVEAGVSYGSGTYTGTFTAPAVGDVQSGVQYGGGGTEYTGTFGVPAVGDVQESVQYGAAGTEFTGTLELPTEAQVEKGVGFGAGGTEFTGLLAGGSDWTDGEKAQIRQALGVTGTTAATSGTGTLEAAFAALADDTEIATAVAAAILVTPANKLATTATGEAAANVTYWAGVAAGAAPATVADLPAAAPSAATVADAVWDEVISGHLTSGTTGARLNTAASASGSGSTAYSNTVTDSASAPLDGVEVWITSDSGGAATVASTTTDTLGAFTVWLDPGTYYLWLAKGGYNFPNPTTITVS